MLRNVEGSDVKTDQAAPRRKTDHQLKYEAANRLEALDTLRPLVQFSGRYSAIVTLKL